MPDNLTSNESAFDIGYPLDEALADANGWLRGTTMYEGMRGWKAALSVIMADRDRLTAELDKLKKDHAQFVEWANPQITTHGEDRLTIDRLTAALELAEARVGEMIGTPEGEGWTTEEVLNTVLNVAYTSREEINRAMEGRTPPEATVARLHPSTSKLSRVSEAAERLVAEVKASGQGQLMASVDGFIVHVVEPFTNSEHSPDSERPHEPAPVEATGLQPVRRWNAKYPGISMLEHNGELIRSGFGPYVLAEDYDRVASLLSEAVRMIEGYRRAGFITNPAALEQASDFALRAGNSHHE